MALNYQSRSACVSPLRLQIGSSDFSELSELSWWVWVAVEPPTVEPYAGVERARPPELQTHLGALPQQLMLIGTNDVSVAGSLAVRPKTTGHCLQLLSKKHRLQRPLVMTPAIRRAPCSIKDEIK